MRLSSRTVTRSSDTVGQVVEYAPQQLVRDRTHAAEQYVQREKERKSTFRLSELVAEQAGIAKMEHQTLQDRIEALALEKAQEIQEKAYKEAYALGLDEGRDKAFQETSDEIRDRLGKVDEILGHISRIKQDLVQQNEAHIITLVQRLVEKIVYHTVDIDKEAILPVLREAVNLAQAEENISVTLSAEDLAFIESYRDKAGQEYQFLKKVRMEKRDDIKRGGCIVETNYGTVDARTEERLQKLWTTLSEKMPKVRATNK